MVELAALRDGDGRIRYDALGFHIASEIPFPQLPPVTTAKQPAPADTVFRFGSQDEIASAAPNSLGFMGMSAGFTARNGCEIVVAKSDADLHPQMLERLILANGLNAIAYQRGLVPLHANACQIGDGAVMFCGDKAAGKSTTTAALAQAGHALLSDDITVLHPGLNNGPPVVWPGVTALKLAEPMLDLFHGTSPLRPSVDWDPKALVRIGAMPSNVPLPVRAIYVLQWGELAVRPLGQLEAVAILPTLLRRPGWLAESGKGTMIRQAWLEAVARLPISIVTVPRRFEVLSRVVDMLDARWQSGQF